MGIFARDHKAVAVGLDQPPDDALAFASGIHVRGVDEITSGLGKGVENRTTFFLGPRPVGRGSERHRAERDLRDAQAAFPEQAVAHQPCSPRPGLLRQASSGNGITPSRSEEHTSELQSLMRISYAVFCLKKKKKEQPQLNT